MSQSTPPTALDFLAQELREQGRRVQVGYFPKDVPVRNVYERVTPLWQFWDREFRALAIESRRDPNLIKYDPHDAEVVAAVKRAEERYVGLRTEELILFKRY